MHRHWSVTLQGLSDSGRAWDEDVPRHLLEDEGSGAVDALSGLRDDVYWHVVLLKQDELFHLRGQWQGVIERQCSRCNKLFGWHASGQTERNFQLGLTGNPGAEDGGCECLPVPGKINMLDILREDIWLAWKADVICSASCKGLCAGCGSNLNISACQCEQSGGNRPFAALDKLRPGA